MSTSLRWSLTLLAVVVMAYVLALLGEPQAVWLFGLFGE